MDRQSRIAVIAVHGVGDQTPGETARAVAGLLQGSGREAGGKAASGRPADAPPAGAYSAFEESPLQVPTSPVDLRRGPAPAEAGGGGPRAGRAARAWDRVRAGLYSSYAAQRLIRGRAVAGGGAGYDFMYHQLERFSGEAAASYRTSRLAGTRSAAAAPEARIDIYEMYWADLSRLGRGLLRMIGEFVQLLIHVSSLGKTTVDLARLADGTARALPALAFLQGLCSWLLGLPIAILNLYLVLLAVGLVVVYVPDPVQAAVAAGGAVAALGTALGLYRRWQHGFGAWCAVQVLGIALGAGAAWLAVARLGLPAFPLLALLWFLLVVLAAEIVATAYETRRGGAKAVARLCGAAVVLSGLVFLFDPGMPGGMDGAVHVIGRTAELVFAAATAFWAVLATCHVFAWIAGEVVVYGRAHCRPDNWDSDDCRIRRAVWTGRLGLFMPASLFVILTLSLWMAVAGALPVRIAERQFGPLFYGDERIEVGKFVRFLVNQAAGTAFDAFFIVTVIACALLLWAFMPAVAAEIVPPANACDPASRRTGRWLDQGFRLARQAGRLALLATFVVLPVGVILHGYPQTEPGSRVLGPLAGLLSGSAVGLVALGSRLGKVFLGLRTVLDVALDVDNWLRERPLDNNPRGRICARYASLLRHVCAYRDADGKGYDAVVIVSHSQGTVITADLLRFLRQSPDPRLEALGAGLPVYLLTMGCPLRQLYGLRFPHLYEWATHAGQQRPAKARQFRAGIIPPDQRPEPAGLGLELWVNAFRSGDYVGRHLWTRDDLAGRWKPAGADGRFVANDSPSSSRRLADVRRVELCLGAGAHTHYFDETASRVGQLLDQLVGVAIAGKDRYAWRFPVLGERC